ncbi:MAG: hypothetical protein WCP98_14030 [Actinomycetes bacterium]
MTGPAINAVLSELDGDRWLMASPMYGSGLRLMERLRLRVLDLELTRDKVVVRDGKGGHKDVRTTMISTHLLNRGGQGVRSPFDGQ